MRPAITRQHRAPTLATSPRKGRTRETYARALLWLLAGLLAFSTACGQRGPTDLPGDKADNTKPAEEAVNTDTTPQLCPSSLTAPELLPGVNAEHQKLEYWLERTRNYGDPDEVIFGPEAIRDHNGVLRDSINELDQGWTDERWNSLFDERFAFLRKQFEHKAFVLADGSPLPQELLAKLDAKPFTGTQSATRRVALAPFVLHCAPFADGYYTPSLDLRFNRNNCSSTVAQELLEVLGPWPGKLLLVRTRHTWGWIEDQQPLSPPLSAQEAQAFLAPERLLSRGELQLSDNTTPVTIGDATLLARAPGEERRAWLATPTGLQTSRILSTDEALDVPRPLTRRAFLEEAFRTLGQAYGWGGEGGGRDCSAYVLELLASFGIEMPRHSADQAQSGTFDIDISNVQSERERLLIIEAAARRGIVLMHFPGHIMVYLGRDKEGQDMAIHAFAEYVTPCDERDPQRPEATETLFKVDRIAVSNLELGRGSSRRAFIERVTKLTVLGHSPGAELNGVAKLRAAAPVSIPKQCKDSNEVALFHSPRIPNTQQPLRLIGTSSRDLGPVELSIFDPDGQLVSSTRRHFGGPPYSTIATIEKPEKTGTWTAVWGDGARIEACITFKLRSQRATEHNTSNEVWPVRRNWSMATENLYAAWVEALFDYPAEQEVSWTNLHSVVRNQELNILHDHLGLGEDEQLRMEPDCADLPYMLRAYFAWKMGLPFSFRKCSRGRAGKAPTCGALQSNLGERESPNEVKAFAIFSNIRVRNGVHSGSGRTHPDDEETDYYPVALDRLSLRAGTTFADPYGHLLVLAGWRPQQLGGFGILFGVDSQPDGTIGRRRFWRGSFLFTPETTDVGAGFKAFRPLIVSGNESKVMSNAELAKQEQLAPFSRQQYEGSRDDFYDTMESLINPRALDPIPTQIALVEALELDVRRRVLSVDNGEQYLKENGYPNIPMPEGYAVFETTGPWEDFSTPSRDMRLLIAIDTVVDFKGRVERNPERFGVLAEELPTVLEELEQTLDKELKARTFEYTRSDGVAQPLSLHDIVARSHAFELSYHPNDCIEIRWGAPDDSDEMKSCKRRAPEKDRQRMLSYRDWFAKRERPPR
ncbi:MAG: NlpC/P60 family protein [Myxococcota bacterium]|jgi:cell wall-associated NlpC family hydrolase/predicted small lipoprotein YifL|nr:NlpC/P60 family protein [Myxococcota bacterium]